MWKNSVFLCLVVFLLTHSFVNSYHVNDQLEKDEIIEAVNNAQTTWKAGRNFHPSLKKDYLKNLLGLKEDPNAVRLPPLLDLEDDIDLPISFDAREKWRYCTGLQTIRDQGSCGSCWAVSSASAFTDRLCIATKGRFNGQLSAAELMSCDTMDTGCNGGFEINAFRYFETNGIVTGGDYGSHEGCQPYPFPKCDHLMKGIYGYANCSDEKPTPACLKTCSNKKYKSHSFQKDLHLILTNSSFSISRNVKKMQREIYKHGPLVAGFTVYDDFLSYQTGVYIHTSGGSSDDGHAVKVIGWGVENGTDYWLVANSWNEKWGMEKGFFKIRRGTNECGFENNMVGGIPKVNEGF